MNGFAALPHRVAVCTKRTRVTHMTAASNLGASLICKKPCTCPRAPQNSSSANSGPTPFWTTVAWADPKCSTPLDLMTQAITGGSRACAWPKTDTSSPWAALIKVDLVRRSLSSHLTATWFTAHPCPLTRPVEFRLAEKIWTGSTSPVVTVASMSLQARIVDFNVPLITHDPP